VQKLEDGDLLPIELSDRPGVRVYTAVWGDAKNGHRIFFRVDMGEVVVVRILHTAMDYYRHL